ncbi:MAG: homoserine O-succinyltransferase [Acidiferrobacterales bacterium]|nr:homoserine O-succinyltransferase [Acidiferrobacterales bacterium]
MPLIANTDLPSFARLRAEGQEVLEPGRAKQQDIRELHIGILNMMPDAALEATERQFLRLVGSCNRIAQFHTHLFTFPEIPRDEKSKSHIDKYYRSFESLQEEGLDAIILSGANPAQPEIEKEPFWEPLGAVVEWAKDNVCSVMCSCLATHAVVQQLWGIRRYKLADKRWGVYSNRITDAVHPLIANINTRFDAPHSHVYEVNAGQFEKRHLPVLAQSREADLHLAVSPDGLRFVFFQGHPEYDAVSLLKEYKREVVRYIESQRETYPPYPEHYFSKEARDILEQHKRLVERARGDFSSLPQFPDAEVEGLVDNTWSDTGKAIVNNWLGLIYQVADQERGKVFMDGVNPADPLGLGYSKV